MSRKQLFALLAVLVVLVAAGAWVMVSKREDWRAADKRVGQRLIPGLVIADVGQIHIKETTGEVHMVRDPQGHWSVRERGGYPAHIERIGDFLTKLADLKSAQVEPLGESQRGRLELIEPAAPDAKNAGILLELSDRDGKSLTRLLLGKKVVRQTQTTAPVKGVPEPSGRYVLTREKSVVFIVSDPLSQAEGNPAPWLARDLIRVSGARTMTSLAGDGKPRWKVSRDSESANWHFADSTQKLEDGKVQDIVAVLIYIALADVATDAAEAGFDQGVTLKIDTFHNTQYTLRIGRQKGDLRYLQVSLTGDPPKRRVAGTKETPEEKKKKDQEFEENYKGQMMQLEREGRLNDWTFLVKNSDIEALLRERSALLPQTKQDSKGK